MGEDGLSVNEQLFNSLALPCGRVIPNRLVKVAMYEHLAPFGGGDPQKTHQNMYMEWSKSSWGMIITGNVQIDRNHLSLGRDVVIPSPSSKLYKQSLCAFRRLSECIRGEHGESPHPLAIMQLNHTGRQSPRFIGGRLPWVRPVAPSSVPLGYGSSSREGWLARCIYWLMFQKPKALSEIEVEDLVDKFTEAALFARDTGFDGVQIHASHGYLLAQFMSPKINRRVDRYSSGIKFILNILHAMRKKLPSEFVIGVKLNSADYVSGSFALQGARDHISLLTLGRIDFIEISGGDYEQPGSVITMHAKQLLTAPADFMTTSSRQAFFRDFSAIAMEVVDSLPKSSPKPLVLLTGGLRTPSQMRRALEQRECDLLGLGRLSVLCPDFLDRLRVDPEYTVSEPVLPRLYWFPKLIGAGVETAWYTAQIRRIAEGKPLDPDLGGLEAVVLMWFRSYYQLMLGLMLLVCLLVLLLLNKYP